MFRSLLGVGTGEYPSFPVDECPEELPDLSKHHSLAADVLREHPGLFRELRGRRTKGGVSFAKCIKTGIDNRGHPMIKTMGAVAGDEECYETFRPFFDELLRRRHGDNCLDKPHSASKTRSETLSMTVPDPMGTYTLSCQVRSSRNLRGIRFPPSATLEERRTVERVCAAALLELTGSAAGKYYPLAGSQSYLPTPGGMSADQEEELCRAGLLFASPDATAALCSGFGRHWPDARGVYVSDTRTFSAWVNEEEHLRAISVRKGGDVQEAFSQLHSALTQVERLLAAGVGEDGPSGFAQSDRLGYLTSHPGNVGTALQVSMIVRLPLVTSQEPRLAAWCRGQGLTVRTAISDSCAQLAGVLEISNRVRLGISEVETVNVVVEAVAALVRAELRLEFGLQGLQAVKPFPTAPAGGATQDDGTPAELVSSSTTSSRTCSQEPWEDAGAVLGGLFLNAVAEGTPETALAPPETALMPPLATPRPSSLASSAARAPAAAPAPARRTEAGRDASVAPRGAAQSHPRSGSTLPAEEALRARTRDTFSTAFRAGELSAALQRLAADKESRTLRATAAERRARQAAGHDASQQERLSRLLVQSCESGALEDALKRRSAQADQGSPPAPLEAAQDKSPARQLRQIRRHVAASMYVGATGGELQKALGSLPPRHRPDKEPPSATELGRLVEDSLIRAHDSGRLSQALAAQAASRSSWTEIDGLRRRMGRVLQDSGADGRLAAHLGKMRDLQDHAKSTFVASLNSGRLTAVLSELRQDERAKGMEEAVMQAWEEQLQEQRDPHEPEETLTWSVRPPSPASGSSARGRRPSRHVDFRDRPQVLEHAKLAQGATEPGKESVQAGPAATVAAESPASRAKVLGDRQSLSALKALSACDRKIGNLSATLAETERLISEREAQARSMEAELVAARRGLAWLDDKIEHQKRLFEVADAKHWHLVDNQRRLIDDIDVATLSHRHALVDLDKEPAYYSRSELSTACTIVEDESLPLGPYTPNSVLPYETKLPALAHADGHVRQ